MERLLPVVLLLTFSSGSLSRGTVDGNWDSCDERLERALDALHRDSARRNRLEEEEAPTIYQQILRSAPLEMSVDRIAVKLPQGARDTGSHWARVERCMFEPSNNSLQTRVIFNDLSVSGMVSLMARDHQPPTLAESCRMTLRLRRAGIDFMTSPIARARGQMRIRTESSFLEPKFASIYAYGCHPTRLDKQIKRQDKWPPFFPPRDAYEKLSLTMNDNYEAAEPRQLVGVSKEMDVVIPNESRQARFLHAPVAKLGIWRKNVWVTKSSLRERRSSEPLLRLAHPTNNTGHSVDKSAKVRLDPSDSLPRILRSTATITPQDFTMALTSKRTNANLESDRNLPANETSLEKVILEETTEGLLENSNNNEPKTNFKRENGSKRTIHQDSRETRELYLDENLDDALPMELDNISRNWQSKEDIAREMEDVFLHGASQALTKYIERQLHPAIKETLMLSMGYTISYG